MINGDGVTEATVIPASLLNGLTVSDVCSGMVTVLYPSSAHINYEPVLVYWFLYSVSQSAHTIQVTVLIRMYYCNCGYK
jgi:hypothetical protein